MRARQVTEVKTEEVICLHWKVCWTRRLAVLLLGQQPEAAVWSEATASLWLLGALLVEKECEVLANAVDVDGPETIVVLVKMCVPSEAAGHLLTHVANWPADLWDVAKLGSVVIEVEVVQLLVVGVVRGLNVHAGVGDGSEADEGDEEEGDDVLEELHCCGWRMTSVSWSGDVELS